MNTRRPIMALLFLASAIFHAFALTWPSISVPETGDTHLLFVLVNLWMANEVTLVAGQELRFLVALIVLTTHQVTVHGYFVVAAAVDRRFDIQSTGVIAGFIVLWLLLLWPTKTK